MNIQADFEKWAKVLAKLNCTFVRDLGYDALKEKYDGFVEEHEEAFEQGYHPYFEVGYYECGNCPPCQARTFLAQLKTVETLLQETKDKMNGTYAYTICRRCGSYKMSPEGVIEQAEYTAICTACINQDI